MLGVLLDTVRKTFVGFYLEGQKVVGLRTLVLTFFYFVGLEMDGWMLEMIEPVFS